MTKSNDTDKYKEMMARARREAAVEQFPAQRARLKRIGADGQSMDEHEERPEPKLKQADVLLALAQEAELFHAPDGTPYADIRVGDHRETWNVRHKGFKRWLSRRFFEKTGGAPSSEALLSALNVVEGRAHFDAPLREVYVRVGGAHGKIFIDLVDETWRAIEITPDGWNVVPEIPIRFRRAAGMKPLPVPIPGGSIRLLRGFLNLQEDGDFTLVVAWLLAALRDVGPYPVLLVTGEQGSAKSTACTVLRSLIDPNTAPLRALPREDRDLFIAANNGHVLGFDNVSGMQPWISDTLCRLSTGGGFAVRKLYSDSDEELFDASRPTILNGIDSVISRPDLADRAIFLTLEPIADSDRQPEHLLMQQFEADRPLILGSLLNGMVRGLRELANTRLDRLPRMADFAMWAAACESAFWPAGTFEKAYRENREDIVVDVLEADVVASAVQTFMRKQVGVVTKTAGDLLGALAEIVTQQQQKSKGWPTTARALSSRLRRAAPFLRKAGIAIEFGGREGHARARVIRLSADGADAGSSGCPETTSEEEEQQE